MVHSFDVDIARQYGMTEAVLFKHLQFWIEKNQASGINYYDGRTWTFSSLKGLQQRFPYMTRHKVRLAMQHLVECGLIVEGNYNRTPYDRTKWYALTDFANSIVRKPQMEDTDPPNPLDRSESPIPDESTDESTDHSPCVEAECAEETERTTEDPDAASDDPVETFFRQCWAIYPHPVGASRIRRQDKIIAHQLGVKFVRAIDRMTHSARGRPQRYQMHGSTFWRGGYRDYLDDGAHDRVDADQLKQELQDLIGRYATYQEALPHMSDALSPCIDADVYRRAGDMDERTYQNWNIQRERTP